MDAVIRQWGDSPALRLPAAVLGEAGLSLGQKLNLTVTQGRIVIEPTDVIEYDLDVLLDAITVGNSHVEQVFGKPVG